MLITRLAFFLLSLAVPIVATTAPAKQPPVILVLGDSLSAAYGMPAETGWVSLLEKRLREQGLEYRVVNASISGETSLGAVARLPGLLEKYRPALAVIESGGNDGLRGLPLADLRQNLSTMLRLVKKSGAAPLLVGMRMPPNYGPEYTAEFHAVYDAVAAELAVPYVPFLLEGVAGRPELMQADGVHASAGAQARLLDNVWPELLSALGCRPVTADRPPGPAGSPAAPPAHCGGNTEATPSITN